MSENKTSDNKMSEIIKTSLENVRDIFDANTVIGEPIPTPNGTTIIPVSKVSMGIATGGLDYAGKNNSQRPDKNFGGGGGTGVTISPVAFLIVRADGTVDLLNVSNPTGPAAGDTVEQITSLIKQSPDILSKIKGVFGHTKKSKSDDEPTEGESEDKE